MKTVRKELLKEVGMTYKMCSMYDEVMKEVDCDHCVCGENHGCAKMCVDVCNWKEYLEKVEKETRTWTDEEKIQIVRFYDSDIEAVDQYIEEVINQGMEYNNMGLLSVIRDYEIYKRFFDFEQYGCNKIK